jgi:hypothetical protein
MSVAITNPAGRGHKRSREKIVETPISIPQGVKDMFLMAFLIALVSGLVWYIDATDGAVVIDLQILIMQGLKKSKNGAKKIIQKYKANYGTNSGVDAGSGTNSGVDAGSGTNSGVDAVNNTQNSTQNYGVENGAQNGTQHYGVENGAQNSTQHYGVKNGAQNGTQHYGVKKDIFRTFRKPGTRGGASVVMTFSNAWEFLISQKGDLAQRLRSFSSRLVSRVAAGDRTLTAEMEERANTLDPDLRAVFLSGIKTNDASVPIEISPESTAPLPPSAKRLKGDTHDIQLRDGDSALAYVKEGYGLVPLESGDVPTMYQVMHALHVGVSFDQLGLIIQQVSTERKLRKVAAAKAVIRSGPANPSSVWRTSSLPSAYPSTKTASTT